VGSLGRPGGGRKLAAEPDRFVTARPTHCRHCGTALPADDHVLHARYDKIDLPPVRPVVAPVPEGLEEGTSFGPGLVAAALYLRYVHALSYQRLSRLFRDLFGVAVSEGALDSLFQRAKRHVDREVAAILTRLRRSRVVCSDETTVRISGRTCWNWVFQNEAVVIHVVRPTRAAAVVNEVLDGHRPAFWVSDLYGGQQGHADLWKCLVHQLRDCQYASEAGDAVFAPRMKRVLLRAVVLARRRHDLAASTRREYRRRLDRDLDTLMALTPDNRYGQRLRKRYAKLRDHLFTFFDHPGVPPDNNGCERELRPTATYRKVTGGFRSSWGADLFAGVKSVLGTAARHGLDAYQAIRQTLCGHSILDPG
jgi:transposase